MSVIDQLAYLSAIPAPDDIQVRPEQRARWMWATVTQESPLRVRLDGQSQALDMTPISLVDRMLGINERVRVHLIEKQLVVAGVATKDTGWTNIAISSGFSAQGTETPQVRIQGDKVYVRGGWSNSSMSTSATFSVGTVPADFRPPTRNALWRWATSAGNAAGAGILNYSTGEIQVRTSSTISGYYMFPAGTFWFRS